MLYFGLLQDNVLYIPVGPGIVHGYDMPENNYVFHIADDGVWYKTKNWSSSTPEWEIAEQEEVNKFLEILELSVLEHAAFAGWYQLRR